MQPFDSQFTTLATSVCKRHRKAQASFLCLNISDIFNVLLRLTCRMTLLTGKVTLYEFDIPTVSSSGLQGGDLNSCSNSITDSDVN